MRDFITVYRRRRLPANRFGFPSYSVSPKRAQQMRHRTLRALGGSWLKG